MMIDNITTSSCTANVSNYCTHRLPCGICRLTMSNCPINTQPCINPYNPVICSTTTTNGNIDGSVTISNKGAEDVHNE